MLLRTSQGVGSRVSELGEVQAVDRLVGDCSIVKVVERERGSAAKRPNTSSEGSSEADAAGRSAQYACTTTVGFGCS